MLTLSEAIPNGGDVRVLRILGLITFRGWRTGPEVQCRLGAWAAVRSSRCRKAVLHGRRVGVDVAEAARQPSARWRMKYPSHGWAGPPV